MRYLALACDYDGTLASEGRVAPETVAALERLRASGRQLLEAGYQCCILDPEGDYDTFKGAVVLGDCRRAPRVAEALRLLEPPDQHVVVNLLGLPLQDRPGFFTGFLAHLHELRARTGRPHWLVADKAHHFL